MQNLLHDTKSEKLKTLCTAKKPLRDILATYCSFGTVYLLYDTAALAVRSLPSSERAKRHRERSTKKHLQPTFKQCNAKTIIHRAHCAIEALETNQTTQQPTPGTLLYLVCPWRWARVAMLKLLYSIAIPTKVRIT